MIFATPLLTEEDRRVLAEIHEMRRALADLLRAPKRWQGELRRTMLARAIRGSNGIEGYVVDEDDAAAVLADEEPISADERTFAEVRGYRHALGYVLQMASDPHFIFDASVLRGMHYMMLAHDLSKSPGQYRLGQIYAHDDRTGQTVYEGPAAELVPGLMEALAADLRAGQDTDPILRGAMAHLNLVMIHPFRDGNGRMARALQTLVLARQAIVEPAFSSIEEWLGQNTDEYYRVLAPTGGGSWQPERAADLWVSFNLRAHHMQAQTVARRADETSSIWTELDRLTAHHHLPDRVTNLLYEAVLGYRLRRSSYVRSAGIDQRTATRDLARLVEIGMLDGQGATRGRFYAAGEVLTELRGRCREQRAPIVDPYPALPAVLRSTP